MSDRPTPSAAVPTRTPSEPDPTVRRRQAFRLAVVVVGGYAAAAALGITAGVATASLADTGGDDHGFEALGAFFLGVAVGLLVSVATLVLATLAGVRWALPPGRRLRTALTVLACMPVVVGLWVEAETWAHAVALPLFGEIGLVVALAAAVTLVGAVAGAVRWAAALVVLATTAALLVTGAAVADWRGPYVERQRAVERYEAADAPLALWRGRQAEGPLPGWSVRWFGWPSDGTADIDYELPGPNHPDRPVRFTLRLERAPVPQRCEQAVDVPLCVRAGTGRDGQPIWGNPTTQPSADLPVQLRPDPRRPPASPPGRQLDAVWIDRPDGRWTLTSVGPLPMKSSDAVDFLDELRAVDADTFVRATVEPLRGR